MNSNQTAMQYITDATKLFTDLNVYINDPVNRFNKDQIARLTPKLSQIMGSISQMGVKMGSLEGEVNAYKEVHISMLEGQVSCLNILKDMKLKGEAKMNYKNSEEIIVISPKEDQTSEKTKEDIKLNINPVETGITGIKNAINGKVIINCKNKDTKTMLKEQIEEKLGNNYGVKIPEKRFPCVKIIGVSESFKEEDIKEKIMKQNEFLENYVPKKISVVNIRKNPGKITSYNIYIEMDGETYLKFIQAGKINIGWERCRVFDALAVKRCYKCYGFNHKEIECKSEQDICPKCTGNHKNNECKANITKEEYKCINCVNTVKKLKLKLDINHPAWSYKCPVYEKKLQMEKAKISFF